ncbi:hypothetical protein Q1695_009803 [Nippostrongylus brasiliensis]|nr:hypothetical protein Q1695_009803 [Nippostrongylus brasiliensis]
MATMEAKIMTQKPEAKIVDCLIDSTLDPRLVGFVSLGLVCFCLICSSIFYLYNVRDLKINLEKLESVRKEE